MGELADRGAARISTSTNVLRHLIISHEREAEVRNATPVVRRVLEVTGLTDAFGMKE